MTHDELIAVIQAHKDGEQLEYAASGFKHTDFYRNVSLDDILHSVLNDAHVRVKRVKNED